MSQMITFPANNEFFRKRKRVHRACEACKKRRKRCSHTFDEDQPEAETGSSSKNGHSASAEHQHPQFPPANYYHHHDSRAPPRGDGREPDGFKLPHVMDGPRAKTPPNFLGYLNPEAVLREQVHRERGIKKGQSRSPTMQPVGQWVDGREQSPSKQPGAIPAVRPNEESPQMTTTTEAKVQRALEAYLDAVGVYIVPPREHQKALLQIYFDYVHPLLPIVDKGLFEGWYAKGTEPRMLLQTMCIVASKHATAADHLLLGDDPRKMGPREFSQRLYNSVIAGIEAKLEKNRVILIQVLALISLHCEGPDGAEQASMHLAQAIHHAHTFGLQFGHAWKDRKSDSQENLEDLFWCLWSLDKINACMNGRPLLMHDRDNSLTKLPTDPEKRSSPFGVWLQISEMLDKVIDYYRPGRSVEETGWEGDDFLGFEEMVGDGEEKLDGPIMSLLSLFHHAMCMASHKSLSINDPVRSTPSYVRQSLSATRVISLLNAEAPEMLPPLPIVPYALSLALSVVYRHFRSRRLKVHINRATDELRQCVKLLNRLRNSWWSAGTMADIGTAVLNNADRSTRAANTAVNTPAPSNNQPENGNRTGITNYQQSQQQPQHQQASTASGMGAGMPVPPQWSHQPQGPPQLIDSSIDPRLQGPPTPSMSHILNPSPLPSHIPPGQHPTSSERIERHGTVTPAAPMTNTMQPPSGVVGPGVPSTEVGNPGIAYDEQVSPENWLNFDNMFENFEGLLGSSGADYSNELYGGFFNG